MPPIQPVGEREIPILQLWGLPKKWHSTLDGWFQLLFSGHIYSWPREENTLCHGRSHEVGLGDNVNRLCSNKECGMMWLASWINAGWLEAESHCSGMRRRTCPFDKEDCVGRGPYLREQTWKGTLQLDSYRLSWFYQGSRQHIILSLNFRPYPWNIVYFIRLEVFFLLLENI